jgi:hypothetical protein
MIATRPLRLACPTCAGTAVAYSCEPRCCFNHVCAGCRTTFQTATAPLGGKLAGLAPPDPPQDSTDPTAACSECRGIEVHSLDDGRVVCVGCGALLALQLEDIDAGRP